MADDTVALLRQLNIENADFFGYSMGAGISLHIAIHYQGLVRKLVVASVTYNNNGFIPGLIAGMENLKPENMVRTPWQEEYSRIAPNPEGWPALLAKTKQLNLHLPDLPAETIQSIKAPTLLIIGDSDIIRPEHAVEMFKLLGAGAGAAGNPTGLSKSQLAILPGTTHVTVVDRSDLLIPMITEFLNAPMKE